MTGAAALVVHAALLLSCAPLLAGVWALILARLSGCSGPPLLQPWRDLLRLARKQPVLPDTTSRLFAAVPFMCLAVLVTAALLVPSFTLGMATAPLADLFVLGGLLAADRYALALAGYDTGTAAGGVGASRITRAEVWTSPAVALIVLALALLAGTSNLDAVMAALRDETQSTPAPLLLAAGASAIVGLVSMGGVRGALLASSQDTAVLDYSGRYLAVVTYAGHLRSLVWLSLLALFLPFGLAPDGAGPLAWIIGIAAWGVKIGVLIFGAAVLEAVGIPSRVTQALGMAAVLALAAVAYVFATQVPA